MLSCSKPQALSSSFGGVLENAGVERDASPFCQVLSVTELLSERERASATALTHLAGSLENTLTSKVSESERVGQLQQNIAGSTAGPLLVSLSYLPSVLTLRLLSLRLARLALNEGFLRASNNQRFKESSLQSTKQTKERRNNQLVRIPRGWGCWCCSFCCAPRIPIAFRLELLGLY